MKILLTFEDGRVVAHFIDVVRLLKHLGHDIFFFNGGEQPFSSHHQAYFGNSMTVLDSLGTPNDYDVWMYDLCRWNTEPSVFVKDLEEFKGKLVCIAQSDGAGFLNYRVSDTVLNKTCLFMRNTIFRDRTLYPPSIRDKIFVSTCYITNSQDFKHSNVPFRQKQKRAIFTGNLTGCSESGDPEEYLCRIKIPMALINAGIPCVYRLHGSNPSWKQKYEDNVPAEHKTHPLDRPTFITEMENSMIVLSLRGNYHTVNRFYEGLASGALVFSTKFRHAVDFYGHGEAGVHYVEIEWDGSDVVEKVKYYFEHLDEAERIAANGRKLWEEYSMLDENKILPPKVVNYYIKGIKDVCGIDISKP